MNTTLKMFPNINKMNAVDYINSVITWNINFEAELRELKEYEETRVDQLIIVRHAIIAVIEEILGEEA